MKSFYILILSFFIAKINFAQELNCQVSIITDARLEITSVEEEIFDQLKQTIYDLMNTTQWTKDKFKVESKGIAILPKQGMSDLTGFLSNEKKYNL
jgi:DNA-binding transcriptional regulator GbsR (MarR family)